jgi:putative endonuclease
VSISKNSAWRSRKGLHYEALALEHLQRQGLQLLQRNFRCNAGEIDLVMLDGEILVFVEVRYRRSQTHGGALATITFDKQRKLLRAARYFLHRHGEQQQRDCRFDVVGVQPGSSGVAACDWIRHAFY